MMRPRLAIFCSFLFFFFCARSCRLVVRFFWACACFSSTLALRSFHNSFDFDFCFLRSLIFFTSSSGSSRTFWPVVLAIAFSHACFCFTSAYFSISPDSFSSLRCFLLSSTFFKSFFLSVSRPFLGLSCSSSWNLENTILPSALKVGATFFSFFTSSGLCSISLLRICSCFADIRFTFISFFFSCCSFLSFLRSALLLSVGCLF
uniref:Putative secreted peptide n=1 Tax=Anopheles braziliensis TaxID=58242 RepID=A0A2M3ZNH9_9DIPT